MWLPVLLLLIACRTSLAFEEYEECFGPGSIYDLVYILELNPTNSYMLESKCSNLRSFLTCADDLIESKTGFKMQELESILEETEQNRFVKILVNVRRLVEELCDDDSQLNKDFKAHSECMTLNRIPEEGLCMKTAETILNATTAIEDEVGDGIDDKMMCMMSAYLRACIATQIHENCGRKAFDTYLRIIRGSTAYKYGICNEDQLEEAREQFLQNLEMNAIERELYKVAFDLRKKRK